jgi:GNAT superfamily N-acetyltransferase
VEVRSAIAGDRDAVIGTFTRAFSRDAIIRFLFPDDEAWPDRAARFFGHYFDVRLAGGEITVCEDAGVVGASLWNPPGGNRRGPEFVEEHWQRTVAATIDPDEVARYDTFKNVLEAMTPAESHWYLGLLGTDPERQRTGIARALLTPMLARADAEGLPVFLETGMPGNVAIYERFGFATVADAVVPAGPRVWGMLRPSG